MPVVINTGLLYPEGLIDPISTAEAEVTIFDGENLTMEKVPNKTTTYVVGEAFTFTITITNMSQVSVEDLIFRDILDARFQPANGIEFVITTTSGTVTSATSNIEIIDIDIDVLSSVTITISGVIA